MNSAGIRVRVFGMLRNYSDDQGFITVSVSRNELKTVGDFKNVFKAHFKKYFPEYDSAELEDCAVATEEEILHSDEALLVGEELSVLPPVCGG